MVVQNTAFVGWVSDSVTHAVKAFDALRLRLTHPTFNYAFNYGCLLISMPGIF